MVRISDIEEALELDSDWVSFYDSAEDAVVSIIEDSDNEESSHLLKKIEDDSSGRYKPVAKDPHFDNKLMDLFVRGLTDMQLVETLNGIIHRSNALRNFEDVLKQNGIDKTWAIFRKERYDKEAVEICRAEGIPIDN